LLNVYYVNSTMINIVESISQTIESITKLLKTPPKLEHKKG